MPPSQLKRLKASLREQGITGQQKSKKEKKKNHGADANKRAQRNAALEGIRQSFNPFEIKAPARPAKFDVTTRPENRKKTLVERPGVSRSLGEETRRKTLLPELNARNKVGGIIDRRIGENDPNMTPQEKMLERFTREKSRKKGSMFDLEEPDDEDFVLTHGGQTLDLDVEDAPRDDYDAASVSGISDDDTGDRPPKRRRELEDGEEAEQNEEEGQPERKKSKAEVMKEVMAKSKLYKHERQKGKEEDEELREELDQGLGDMLALLRGHKRPPPPAPAANAPVTANGSMNPEREALINAGKSQAEIEYDKRLWQMKLDKRAAPTTRTKTEEEKAEEEAKRLKELEEKRMRRMRGEEDSSDEEDSKDQTAQVPDGDEDIEYDDAREFGLTEALKPGQRPPGVDDEDDFVIDDDLVASGSEPGEEAFSDSDMESSDEEDDQSAEEDEEDEFVRDYLSKDQKERQGMLDDQADKAGPASKLAFTYPCPRSHEELLEVLKGVPITETVTVVQRIRALYHPQLSAENKEKLADFSTALVDHTSYLAMQDPPAPLSIIENLIRHLHSLSRTYATVIATAFRVHMEKMHENGEITPGDLVILTAIGSIYPTSDHFHQVVTPATTIMARWLGMTTPKTPRQLATGAYLVALCLKYQTLSKRYIPELIRFTSLALKTPSIEESQLAPHIRNTLTMIDLWSTLPAFPEAITPTLLPAISSLPKALRTKPLQHIKIHIRQALLSRRPLALHSWRPLPIRTAIPRFEEGFNPDKHYDPDLERREGAKLRAEYKRERKGALRELRKDASFVAREKLREKKEADKAYEAKYKRLVAEIQGEEGREKNAYERERKARKSRK
ncbi:Nop14-like protein [Saccharata proteae CBS 121410]|uniref:Nop14-like protein n=1 Tax=Saccharata proteae CBS 121410 TaxID=1314787 RepID=A0A9P4HXP3_9PEZI|nr:Nop14-like protein [Saccharata proteae CBS 121410]